MPNIPNPKRLVELLESEFPEGSVYFDRGNFEDEVNPINATHWHVADFSNGYKNYSGKLPKQKPVTFEYIMERIAKKQNRESVNYKTLFEQIPGIVFKKLTIYPTSYGVGVFRMDFMKRDNLKKKIKTIEKYLDSHNIEYKNEYSEAHWVYRFKISQSSENIQRIKKLTQKQTA